MKVAKLSKLKSAVLKKWPSFNKLDRSLSGGQCAATAAATGGSHLHPVYVGKTRRRYFVSSEVIAHPLFQVLVIRSDGSDGTINVACEVVMFEHLLWMLENADSQLDTMDGDELVEFYTTATTTTQ